jgi:hypothetical protein
MGLQLADSGWFWRDHSGFICLAESRLEAAPTTKLSHWG